MSFSNLLKNAQATNAKAQTLMASPASVMTLSLENEPVETLIEAYSGDEYIRLDGYDWYEDFEDNNYSTVDKNKNITVDPSQVNITQETNSQFIPFKISRYWDGIDLITMRLWIHYVNSAVDELIQPVNVQYNSEFITFGWLVEGNATQIAGALEFEIIADGTIKSASNVEKQYTWRTKPNGKLNIIEALKCRGEHIDTTLEDWTTTVLNPMSTMLLNAQKAASEAKEDADRAWSAAENVDAVIISSAVDKAIEQADTKYSTLENFNALSNSVEDNTLAISNINDTTHGVLANSKQYTDSIVGTLPEGITSDNVVAYVQEVLLNYYTKEQVNELFEKFDISKQLTGVEGRITALEDDFASFDGLAALNISYDEETNTISFFNGEEKIKDIVLDVTSDIATALSPIQEDLQSIHDNIDNLPTTLESDYYNKTVTDEKLAKKANQTDLDTVTSDVNTNKTDIGTLSDKVIELSEEVNGIDKSPRLIYDILYEEDKLSILEGTSEDTLEPKTTVTITGGSGGASTSSTLKIGYVTKTPLVVTTDGKALITYTFSGTDSSGDAVLEGNATWKVDGTVVANNIATDGENTFDVTEFISIGTHKVLLTITDEAGSLVTKSWTVQKVDVKIESTFDDSNIYPIGEIEFQYTPYGSIPKTVHFVLDGKEIGTVETTVSGIPMSFMLPIQEHGSHLLDVYITATINGNNIESNHISKDIMWVDSESDVPVISTVYQSFTAMQYDTTNIVYTVYDPLNESPTVTISTGVYDSDGDIEMSIVSTQVLTSKTSTYSFKPSTYGNYVIEIKCGVTTKTLHATVEKISIDVTPVSAGLIFDFNPVGYSNDDDNRLWKDGSVSMSVSDNFDWVNGGYQFNKDGDQYFCIKAGTSATIDYKLFADDAKVNGKEMKLVFKTTNISVPNTRFLHCVDNTTGYDFIGTEMFTQEAKVYCGGSDYLTLPYSEEDIIEFEFNITPLNSDIPMIMGYEDGVSTSPIAYDTSANFTQNTPQPITIGSDYCDVHIYRLKAYNTALTAKGILNNFIADARSAEEMIKRYNRNQIYKDVDGAEILDPYTLAEKCPWLRVVIVEAPRFTQDKDDKVSNTTITYMYKNGDPVLDNWVATNCIHNGQGTSSNDYGAAGRNLLLDLKKSGLVDDTGKEIKPKITLGDGSTTKKITLTRNSVEINRLNFKVNVASCEHANNALLQKRFDTYNPYKRAFVRGAGDTKVGDEIEELEDEIKDLNKTIKNNNKTINGLDPVKDEEEIAEIQLQINGLDPVNDAEEIADLQKQIDGLDPVEDAEEIAELQGKNAEANIEISNLESQISELEKLVPDAIAAEIAKIRDTMEFVNAVLFIRETDPDVTQHTEFADNDYHFYSIGNIGDSKKNDDTKLTDPDDPYECIVEILDVDKPLSTFPSDEESLNILDNVEDFSGTGSYEYRYIYEDGTDEENAEAWNYCANKWREFYKFIVQSSDEDFKAHFEDYMVLDSALYYYLYTLRYMMVDNRAKNTFFHYGKTDEVDENGEPIRKWDMSFNYDDDTGLGSNNYGKMAYRYGLEDFDVDDAGDEVFRGSQSTFFCRIRDLFADELCDMYNALESKGCWNSNSLINQFESWQDEFPEELWRLGIERVYIRTYNSSYINGAGETRFFNTMCHGRKKYSRRQFERSQEKYMSSKFQSTVAANDKATIRCTNPSGDLVVPVSYKLKLTPYAYMYLNCAFGATTGEAKPVQIRAVPNVEYEIPYDGKNLDILNIYSASLISSFGDLSSFYADTVDVGMAAKLKELIIGNSTEGYNNPYLTSVALKTNPLLEKLNIENVSNLTMSFDLSAMNNLKELYAHGSNIGSVTFADRGMIETAELPAVTSFSMKNLIYLTNLDIASLDKLTSLVVENCDTIDLVTILEKAPYLNRLRITEVDWKLDDVSLLERLYKMKGFNKDGYNIEQSVLTGTVTVAIIKQQQLYDYQKAWPDLEIVASTIVEQFPVKFMNTDGTVLEVQYVDKGGNAVDPTTREDNPLSPTIPSTIQYDYTFAGWDSSLLNVFSERTITAIYTSSLRSYTIKYVSKGVTMQESTGLYGENVPYTGIAPTYTGEESGYKYYLFNRWDKSGFLTGDFDENGVKTVNAIYDEFKYTDKAFEGKELSELSPVEIYAMNKLGMYRDVVTDMDDYTIELGHDFNYDDIESVEIIGKNSTLGSQYKNTVKFDASERKYLDTGIQLFDVDKDFVLAIDYKFTNNIQESVLAQCYQGNGKIGFQLQYNTNVRLKWTASTTDLASVNQREMVVIRHKKGDTNLYVYSSNLNGNNIEVVSLSSKEFSTTSTLVFGCEKLTSTNFSNYASGEIYWSKLWYADLGENVCKQLAAWTHEKLTLEACGFNRYYIANNPDEMCSFSLLSTHLLDRKSKWNTTNTNVGGWAASKLNSFLNARLYEAMPTQIKLLLKQVQIASSAGNKSSEITSSNCYITVPALKEVNPSINKEPYNSEGTTISYLNQAQVSPKRAFADGTYYSYWLRSPNVEYTNYVYRIDAEGKAQAITNATDELGIVILLSF